MELRPCIDIHNGKVKQLVGGSIQDQGDSAQENYISSQDAAWYARLFQEKGLKNGHVILLNSKDSAYYEQTRQQALSALQAYPAADLQSARICLQRRKCLLPGLLVISAVFAV